MHLERLELASRPHSRLDLSPASRSPLFRTSAFASSPLKLPRRCSPDPCPKQPLALPWNRCFPPKAQGCARAWPPTHQLQQAGDHDEGQRPEAHGAGCHGAHDCLSHISTSGGRTEDSGDTGARRCPPGIQAKSGVAQAGWEGRREGGRTGVQPPKSPSFDGGPGKECEPRRSELRTAALRSSVL